jgi:hypothetical protein
MHPTHADRNAAAFSDLPLFTPRPPSPTPGPLYDAAELSAFDGISDAAALRRVTPPRTPRELRPLSATTDASP